MSRGIISRCSSVQLSLFFLLLTPTRWGAKRCSAFEARCSQHGLAVLARTVQNHIQNQQVIEITRYSPPVLRFWVFHARDAHVAARVRVRPRAHVMREANPRTSEPVQYIYIYHRFIGSIVGSERFWPEPTLFRQFFPGLADRRPSKIPGFNCGTGLPAGLSSEIRGRGGESFGDFGAIGCDLELAGLAGENGANPPLSMGRGWGVGTASLERWAERRRNAGLERQGPLTLRQARTAWRALPGTHPMPPAGRAAPPISIAPEPIENSIGLRPEPMMGKLYARWLARGRTGRLQTGPGEGWVLQSRAQGAGGVAGMQNGSRCAEPSAGVAHVN